MPLWTSYPSALGRGDRLLTSEKIPLGEHVLKGLMAHLLCMARGVREERTAVVMEVVRAAARVAVKCCAAFELLRWGRGQLLTKYILWKYLTKHVNTIRRLPFRKYSILGECVYLRFFLVPRPTCNGRDTTLFPLRARTENCSEEAITGMQHAREEAEREGTVVAPNATWPNREPQLFCHLVVLDHSPPAWAAQKGRRGGGQEAGASC